jgi:hypothetical protein
LKKETLTPKLLYSISDNAHFCFGALMVFAAFVLYRPSLWYVVSLVIGASGLKEWLWDPQSEDAVVAGSGARDWLGYCTGCAVALVLLWVFRKL